METSKWLFEQEINKQMLDTLELYDLVGVK